MPDKEKVIKGLELCEIGSGNRCYETECPYYKQECTESLKNDILKLLKEQEPKQVVDMVEFAEGMKVGKCPSCARSFVNLDTDETKFCKSCGQAVKWG